MGVSLFVILTHDIGGNVKCKKSRKKSVNHRCYFSLKQTADYPIYTKPVNLDFKFISVVWKFGLCSVIGFLIVTFCLLACLFIFFFQFTVYTLWLICE